MMFTTPALRWLEVIFLERFGQSFRLSEVEHLLSMDLPGHEGQILFDRLDQVFHQSQSDFRCDHWEAEEEGYTAPLEARIPAPGSLELERPLVHLQGPKAWVHYDIPGLTYWMLTRLEEIGRTDLDNHNRFPATSSHAFQHDYLERPIVDEWLNILGQIIQRVWPQIELKKHQFEMKVSHDVDGPARYAFQGISGLARTMADDVISRKSFRSALLGPWIWMNSRKEIHPLDPANTFDWLMDQSENNGLTSAFYFICGRTDPRKDAQYDPEMPQIRALMRKIHKRGHEIGLHPSYNTYNKPDEIRREAERLQRVCSEEGINQSEWGGRMHFLRWDQSKTLKAWNDAGMAYDSSLGYADRPGFRCGTCHEYPAFDVMNDRQLRLRIRPLVAMDCTVMAEKYLGLGATEQAYEKFRQLKEACWKVGGTFTLLWHNSYFWKSEHFRIYQRLLRE